MGLSAAKARYVLNLAEAVSSGSVPLDAIDDSWEDAAIVAALTSSRDRRFWTAEMFLIFSLNRPDVLPVHDLGIRAALRDLYGLSEPPGPRNAMPCRSTGGRIARSPVGISGENVDTPQGK